MMANDTQIESKRRWISALAVTVSAIVSYMAFWHLWPIPTFLIGCAASLVLIVSAVIYYRSG
jgi:CHASE2 domain-containing sensor protein